MKLHQLLAIEKGERNRGYAALTELHKKAMKPALYNGFSKSYKPNDDEGERFPDENKRVQLDGETVLLETITCVSSFWDMAFQKDSTNTVAKADVVVDGDILIKGAPPTFLLFLEKQLSDLRTHVDKMPTLSPDETWMPNSADTRLRQTEAISTSKSKKVQRPIVMYDATEHHPAQTQMINEDIQVGTWAITKLSGAFTVQRKLQIVARIDVLTRAVKLAREEANGTEVIGSPIAEGLLSHLFS
jgi:hypothetical protein